MFEALLGSGVYRANFPTIPDNGPGPTTLIRYDETYKAGLFGDLDNSEFVTPEQIEALSNVTLSGVAANRGTARLWAKYLFNEKVIYVPKRVLRTGTSWNNLYAAGFVYGLDGPGKYPSIPDGPVNQLKEITMVAQDGSTCKFRIRLISVSTIDPNNTLSTDPTIQNSEWSKLIERTWSTNGIDAKWATYGAPGSSVIGIESRPTYTEYAIVAAGNSNAYFRSYIQKVGTSGAWLPVLELVEVIRP